MRGYRGSISSQIVDRFVYSDEEFRQALVEVASTYNPLTGLTNGGRIIVASPIITTGYIINKECAGITIDSLPGCAIKRDPGALSTEAQYLFGVDATDVTIRNIVTDDAYPFDFFVITGKENPVDRLRIERCVATSKSLYIDYQNEVSQDISIVECTHKALSTGNVNPGILARSPRTRIVNCSIAPSASNFSIIMRGEESSIIGNYVKGGAISTSTTLTTPPVGFCVVMGNISCGAIGTNASDAVGLNT